MPRATHLVLAAGLAGALLASILTHAFSTPAIASPGWSAAEPKVGTVDVLRLLERMLESEPYVSAREATSKVWNDQIQPLADERDNLVQTIQTLTQTDPNAPQAQELYQQYQGLQQRINSLSQEASRAIDAMSAQQLADAYKKIYDAVQVVATANGYDRVFSSRMTAEGFNAENTNVVVQEVLLRPVLRNLPEADLTSLIFQELGVPETAPAPAEGPEPAPGGDGGGGGGE